jgi:hypothetical protein
MPRFYSDDNDDFDPGDPDLEDGCIEFADPGGRSALRAGERTYACPTCKRENMLCLEDKLRGYQCDTCADNTERFGGPYGY